MALRAAVRSDPPRRRYAAEVEYEEEEAQDVVDLDHVDEEEEEEEEEEAVASTTDAEEEDEEARPVADAVGNGVATRADAVGNSVTNAAVSADGELDWRESAKFLWDLVQTWRSQGSASLMQELIAADRDLAIPGTGTSAGTSSGHHDNAKDQDPASEEKKRASKKKPAPKANANANAKDPGEAASTESHSSKTQAMLDRLIEQACRTASRALLEGEDSTSGEERDKINVVLGTLFHVNQAVRTCLVADRILQSGQISSGAKRGGGAGGGKKRKGGGGAKKGRDAGDGDGDERNGGAASTVTDDDLMVGIGRFSALEAEDANRSQQLLLYLLNCAQQRGYRRMGGDLYRRLETPEGHHTPAWEVVCTIQDFVYECTRKEIHYDMWLALTSMRANMSSVVEYLTNCRDVQLPDLVKDRRVFAFRNGIYVAGSDKFVRYGDKDGLASVLRQRSDRDLVAAKYFDVPFPEDEAATAVGAEEEWQERIATPHLQCILDFQGMSAEVSRWMYVMIGRLIYEVNEKDAWQVIPYLRGAASSGKSTILTKVCRSFYERADVGVLSNNIERKFGLSALWDKLLFIGPEIKGDIALEQAEFQSMVSGETVQVAIKNKTARTVDWSVPGILAGNEVPGWVDNSGSINRRIVLFDFPKRVHNADMELGKKLQEELPRIILKANRAYLQAVKLYARQNVWQHLPQDFHASKDDFSASVNSFVHFMQSGALEFGDTMRMPLRELHSAYSAHISQYGLKRVNIQGMSALQSALSSFACTVSTSMSMRNWGGQMVNDRFVLGCDIRRQPAQVAHHNDDSGVHHNDGDRDVCAATGDDGRDPLEP